MVHDGILFCSIPQTVDGLGLDVEEVVAVIVHQVVFWMSAKSGGFVLYSHLPVGVVGDEGRDAGIPAIDAGLGRFTVHQAMLFINCFEKILHIDLPEILKFNDSVNEGISWQTPINRVLTAGISLGTRCCAGSQRAVIVIGDKEKLTSVTC